MRLLHPIPTGTPTDGFGPRGHVPGIGDLGFHHGTDWAAPAGTPIRAAHDGVVRLSYFDRAGGWLIYLTGDGYETSYQHMQARSPIPQGGRVRAGDIIGHVGNTGASTGSHLHFEAWIGGPAWGGGTAVDPLPHIGEPDNRPPHIHPQIIDGDEEMKPWIADVNGTWYLIIATGSGKPNAAILPGNSGMGGGGAAKAGIPVIRMPLSELRKVATV